MPTVNYAFSNSPPGATALPSTTPSNSAPGAPALPSTTPSNSPPGATALPSTTPSNAAPGAPALPSTTPNNAPPALLPIGAMVYGAVAFPEWIRVALEYLYREGLVDF